MIPSFDVVGRIGAVEPEQIAGISVKVGVTSGLIVTVRVMVVAHKPESGVNVKLAIP